MEFLCGHHGSMFNIRGKIHPDPVMEDLILSDALQSVQCYGCLKDRYTKNINYTVFGFPDWNYGSASTKAYASLLRHIAIMTGLPCDKNELSPNYWINNVFGIESKFKKENTQNSSQQI
jgi:hypothetical protein